MLEKLVVPKPSALFKFLVFKIYIFAIWSGNQHSLIADIKHTHKKNKNKIACNELYLYLYILLARQILLKTS